MEGGQQSADKTEFTECWRRSIQSPYIMRLALSAGIGGLLFGYDTGVISGALLYIRDDFEQVDKKTWLQETIVSMAVAGAIIGAAFGGWMNDKLGRRKTLLMADVVFFLGAIVMAAAPAPWVILIGRILVGLGVGMASMTAPLYISEASPAKIRGALVSINSFLVTGGQFLSYLINLAFTRAPGTWRWMLGVAGVPALVQFILMLSLPESPRWLYRQSQEDKAKQILSKILLPNEVEEEIKLMHESIETEKAEEGLIGQNLGQKLKGALANEVIRRALYAGIIVQVTQQFVGINTVMYYSPTIVQFAGIASNSTALALSLVTSGLNAFGSILSMLFVDRFGRRKLMLVSMIGIIVCLVALSVIFNLAAHHSPTISNKDTLSFGANSTCQAYTKTPNFSSWNCMQCLQAECAFCSSSSGEFHPGACLASSKSVRGVCHDHHRVWFSQGCPSRIGILAVGLLGLYILAYSPGMGTVPWVLNSEIYPLRFRGLGGGIAAVFNWCSNLIVSESFLSMTKALGSSGTFLLFAGFSFLGLLAIYMLVPETKGLQFEEVEKLLQKGFRPFPFDKKKEDIKEKEDNKEKELKQQGVV
ncbi:inositol transporter 4 [Arachis stenosperma]|uniref:inositol transporter 4 n=1 Tax=Arachis stenosperma TaxID=217475 RepID=UPI0025ACF36C|nr:inositol transporter 4 [Arachis stenosperma]